jgi:S-disulfanyl-L-cysteine oxidoreductase SoxD
MTFESFRRHGTRCAIALALVVSLPQAGWAQKPGAKPYSNLGREATAAEVKAWDIDVRPDFAGLPKGRGSVAQGQEVWEAKCASCHGVFGESNEVFTPLVGGTTAKDAQSGRVATLREVAYPQRTTLMKAAHVSTLWDYINRAMPWNAPKSLSTDEVYAVTAFMLNLGNVVPDNFVLSDQTMAEAQARMPNRLGMSQNHAMWPGRELGKGKAPDVRGTPCMKNCPTDQKIGTFIPDFARNAHGNLAEQNRLVGAQLGVDSLKPAPWSLVAGTTLESLRGGAGAGMPTGTPAANASGATGASTGQEAKPVGAVLVSAAAVETAKVVEAKGTESKDAPNKAVDGKAALALAAKNACTACHGTTQKIVGPSFVDIGKRHGGQSDYLQNKIVKGGAGVWGLIPMPPQTIAPADAKVIAQWLAAGAPR